MRFTPEQYREYQIRTGQFKAGLATAAACSKEIEELHYPIIRWLRDHRIPFAHNRTDMESTAGNGVPDFIFPYRGKVLFVECKTKTGKLSTEQLAWKMGAEQQGQCVHVIRTMDEFYTLVL